MLRTKAAKMLANRTFRLLIIGAVTAFMFIATVEAAPASGTKSPVYTPILAASTLL